MKFHEILISTAFVGVIFMGFVLFYANGVQHYNVPSIDYSNASHINASLQALSDNAQSTRSAMSDLQGLPLGLDILGSLLVGAYGAIITMGVSTDIIFNIFLDGSSFLNLGEFGDTLLMFAGTALLIAVFIGIFAHYINQSERI
jgi:hypothetical protein